MGTCMSRCASSSQEEHENIQDKLVISQTPLPTFRPSKEISPKQLQTSLSSPPFKQISPPKQITSPSPPSSLSTTPTASAATTTTAASCISTTTFSSSSTLSCASSSGATNDDGGEILSRPSLKKKENARSSPTDQRTRERHCSTPKKNPTRFQKPSTKEEPPKLNVGTPQQPNLRRRRRRSARSTSPSLSQQRSNRSEKKEQYSVPHSRQNLASHSTKENSKKNGVSSRSRSPYNSQRFLDGRSDVCSNPFKGRSRARRGGHSPSPSPSGGGSFNTDSHSGHPPAENNCNANCKKGATTTSKVAPRASRAKVGTMTEKENTRPSSNSASASSTTTHRFCLEKGPHGDYDHTTHGAVISKKLQDRSSLPVEEKEQEDGDIPLISLDCFIFL